MSSSSKQSSKELTSAPLGQPIPLDDHACSVSLPTWSSVVGYEEGDPQVSNALSCGYPRFVYHPYVLKLMTVALEMRQRRGGGGGEEQEEKEGEEEEEWDCLLLPSGESAARCHDFLIRALGYCPHTKTLHKKHSSSSSSSNSSSVSTLSCVISSDNAINPTNNNNQQTINESSSSSSLSPFQILNLNAANVHALLFPARTDIAIEAKTYWQHTGEVVSSRRAEAALKKLGVLDLHRVTFDYYCPSSSSTTTTTQEEEKKSEEKEEEEEDGSGVCWVDYEKNGWDVCPDTMQHHLCLHPASSSSSHDDKNDNNCGFPNYQDMDPYQEIKKRIANIITSANDSSNNNKKQEEDNDQKKKVVLPSDVFLCPSGMSSIYMALRSARRRRLLLSSSSSNKLEEIQKGTKEGGGGTAIVYGFPYLDTLKLCSRPEFVPDGVEFFGHGDAQDLSSLQSLLAKRKAAYNNGNDAKICALITEFPSNPLLRCPDIYELRRLANEYDFCLIVDDTIGNFANLNLLSSGLADAVCTSLTKLYNGRGDAMAGSLIVNTQTEIGRWMKEDLMENHVDHEGLWEGDATAICANSVDFLERSSKINETAEKLADWLADHEDVAMLYYPKYTMDDDGGSSSSSTKNMYDRVLQDPIPISTENQQQQQQQQHRPGYGGLMSVILHSHVCQRTFFDHLDCPKGPSLGTNFTLAAPYTLLAHYHELDFATSYGVMPNLLRISVGLEDFDVLKTKMEEAFRESRLYPKVPPIRRASPVSSSSAVEEMAVDEQKRMYSTMNKSSVVSFANHRCIARYDHSFTGSGLILPSKSLYSPLLSLRSGSLRNRNHTFLSYSTTTVGGPSYISASSSSATIDEAQRYSQYMEASQRLATVLGFVGTRGRRFARPLPSAFRLG